MCKKIAEFYNKYSVVFSIVGFLMTIGSICLTIWISKQAVTLPQKELSCMTTSNNNLVLMLNDDNNLKLVYGDREVSKPYITSIVVQNTGAYAITNEDFLRPFLISFDKNDDILAVNIGECSNSYIKDEVLNNSEFSNQTLSIDNFFLNQGEMFTVDIVSDGILSTINFDTRLNGISKLNLIDVKPNQTAYVIFTPNMALFLLGISILCVVSSIVLIILILIKNRKDRYLYEYLESAIKRTICKENESNKSTKSNEPN